MCKVTTKPRENKMRHHFLTKKLVNSTIISQKQPEEPVEFAKLANYHYFCVI